MAVSTDKQDLALCPPEVLEAPGAAYGGEARHFQGIPGVERTPGGRLWASWYGGPGYGEDETNYVILHTSADDGRTWADEPTLVIMPVQGGHVRTFDPAIWLDPLGRLWLFWAQSRARFDGRGGVWAIVSNNPDAARPTWSHPRRIADGVMMNKPVVLSSGEWVLPVALWRHHAQYMEDAPELNEHRGSHMYVSEDEGRTWQRRGTALVPETTADEHAIVELADGRLWMLVRTRYGIGQSFSDDHGWTWSEGQPSNISHTSSRFFIRRLHSGNLLLVKHHAIDVKGDRSDLRAFVSLDDGAHWQGGLQLDQRQGISYPDGTQGRDGRIDIVYDHARRCGGQILMGSFTEEDAAAGRPVTSAFRQRVLINKAAVPPDVEIRQPDLSLPDEDELCE